MINSPTTSVTLFNHTPFFPFNQEWCLWLILIKVLIWQNLNKVYVARSALMLVESVGI